jgi:DNA-binding GntR family transcriptional regulator
LIDRLGAIVTAVLAVSFRLQQRSFLPSEAGLVLHERVRDAIAAGDGPGAEAAMLAIIEAARGELEGVAVDPRR